MKMFSVPITLFFGLPALVFSQPIWQRSLPLRAAYPVLSGLSATGNTFFVSGSNGVAQLDQAGSIVGHVITEPSNSTPQCAVLPRASAAGGHPYFIFARRGLVPTTTYQIAEYRPGAGVVNLQTFADSLPLITQQPVLLLDLPDGSFWALGKKFFRKMTYSQTSGFVEHWSRPLDRSVASAVWHAGQVVVAETNGRLSAFDENGQEVWVRQYPVAFHSVVGVPGGLVACGRDTSGMGIVLHTDAAGAEIWKTETNDKEYWSVTTSTNGGFAACGQSAANRAVLVRLSDTGTVLWQSEYAAGVGLRVLEAPGGGFLLLSRTSNGSDFVAIKTDALGQTGVLGPGLVTTRQIISAGVQATFGPTPSLFSNEAPLNSVQINPVFAALSTNAPTINVFSPWLAGFSPGGDLHLSAATYPILTGKSDFRSGFMKSIPGDFRRVWAASRDEINRLRRDFGADNTLDQPVPFDLLTWPGKGNPHLRYNPDFTPVSSDPKLFPAPFVDANNDGIYNVYDGDYPQIKGDAMAWWVFTDSAAHTATFTDMLGVDVQAIAYVFDCPQNETVDQAVFAEYTFIHRGQEDYHNVRLGFFVDPEIGCYNDDYIGSLPDASAFYVYNSDSLDGTCPGPGFGTEIPVEAVTFLNRTLDRFIAFNNASIGQYPPAMTDPQTPWGYWNYLQGTWSDGSPLTRGGTGFNPGSTAIATHMFPDNPADNAGWTLCAVNPAYADRRAILSHGPFEFAAGDTFRIQIAFSIHANVPLPCPDIATTVQPAVVNLRQWQNNGILDAAPDLAPVHILPPGQVLTLNAAMTGGTGYAWSTGATTPSIKVSAPGEYTVTITSQIGCEQVENVLVQTESSTGQPALTPAWTLAPNPAREVIRGKCLDCSASSSLRTVLRNAQGVELCSENHSGNTFHLETLGLAPGFYALEMWQNGRFLGSKKVVLLRG